MLLFLILMPKKNVFLWELSNLHQIIFLSMFPQILKGLIVKGSVTEVDAKGAVIELAEGITGYLKVSEISQDRIEDASTVIKQGDEVEVVITQIDRRTRKISVSMKAKESKEEKTAMENYKKKSPESNGSTLGDLLKKVKDN